MITDGYIPVPAGVTVECIVTDGNIIESCIAHQCTITDAQYSASGIAIKGAVTNGNIVGGIIILKCTGTDADIMCQPRVGQSCFITKVCCCIVYLA